MDARTRRRSATRSAPRTSSCGVEFPKKFASRPFCSRRHRSPGNIPASPPHGGTMCHATIAGTGRAIPDRILTNADLAKMVETSDEWITSRTGIRERRVASEGDVLSDFCVRAARPALADAGVTAADLDTVILSTCTPDHLIPGAAPVVQHKLGAKKAAAFDLNAACSGWLYGLHVADGLIQSGKAKNILLIGAEFLTRFVDYTDRNTCILFGDGAGATVLKAPKADKAPPRRSLDVDPLGRRGRPLHLDARRRVHLPAESSRDAREEASVHPDEGWRDVQVRDPIDGGGQQGSPRGERFHDLRCELAPPASGERADHHGCRRAPADPARALHEQHRALREHERGVDSDRARRVRARWPAEARGPHPHHGVRRRPHVGCRARPLVTRWPSRSCFPGKARSSPAWDGTSWRPFRRPAASTSARTRRSHRWACPFRRPPSKAAT